MYAYICEYMGYYALSANNLVLIKVDLTIPTGMAKFN